MLKFAPLGRFDLKAGEFTVETVEDTYSQCNQYPEAEISGCEQNRRNRSANHPSDRQLVWPNWLLAQAQNEKPFNGRVRPSRQIQCPFLHRIKQSLLGVSH